MKTNVFKSIISIVGATVMFFTPDEVDHIIEAALAAYGCGVIFVKEEKEKKNSKSKARDLNAEVFPKKLR
jgi:cysteine synthase